MEIIAYQILPLLLETVEIMTACLVEMVAGGLLFYSFLLSSDGETTAGAITVTVVDIQAQLANCCCETREAIQSVNYNMAQNTCALQNTMNSNTRDIIDSQNAGARAILDYLCNEKISNLQAENNDLRRAASQDRQSALLTTAMASQTQQLINAINPAPIPAYQVPNPNTYYGCGCNTGCNC